MTQNEPDLTKGHAKLYLEGGGGGGRSETGVNSEQQREGIPIPQSGFTFPIKGQVSLRLGE